MPANFNGATYTQNFDTLAISGTNIPWNNDSTIAGWSLFSQTAGERRLQPIMAVSGSRGLAILPLLWS